MSPSRSSRPVCVAHVCVGLHVGGMERLLVEFARHADRDRFALRFLALGEAGSVADELAAMGCEVIVLREPPGLRPRLPFVLADQLRRWGAEVVHTHNTKPLLYAAPAARVAGAGAVIHTRHGQRHGAGRRQTALFNLAARCADRIVSVSRDSATLARAQGAPAAKLRVIHNGIDLARFAATGPAANGPAVVVSRLSPEKDLHTLLRAAALVARQDPAFRLDIAGDGPCRADLEALARSLAIAGRTRFLGQVNDVPRLLAGSSMFILPSLTEGIALTLLEAMACGLPSIATRVGGNPEVVEDGQTGVLVPAASPGTLTETILRLRANPSLARRMGDAGRRRVEQLFDVRRMVARYQDLYLEVLASRRDRLRASA